MTEEHEPKGISRRTVAKGLAWAIPAVPLVVAAPAYAASPQCIGVTVAAACKYPGAPNEWSYLLKLCFSNNCGGTYTVWFDHLENNSQKLMSPCTNQSFEAQSPFVLGPGQSQCFGPYPYSTSSSASDVVVFGWIGTKSGPYTEIGRAPTSGAGVEVLDCSGTNPCTAPPAAP